MVYDVFKLTEIVGTSNQGMEQAVESALARARKSLKAIRWFHVTDLRGKVDEDGTLTYQVTLKVGFGVEGED